MSKCYTCKYRRSISGDTHSSCHHPDNKVMLDDPLLSILGMMKVNIHIENKIKVSGNVHGIKNGWFNWPFNFDPVWLESCDGYEKL